MELEFYHATTKANWELIKKEGVLWGKRDVLKEDGSIDTSFNPDRCTYLAFEKENAVYGKGDGSGEWAEPEILLRVMHDPTVNPKKNHQADWQLRVYEPIPVENCVAINVPRIFDCICCGNEIVELEPYGLLPLESLMWGGGVVDKMAAGYGSKHDTDMFYFGICDACVDERVKNGRLKDGGNYMHGGSAHATQ